MPTQTYTPTASWNNTSLYQENGDVSDATVLQNTGEDAMDNVAYLTGGNTEDAVRRIATLADLATLKALTSARDRDYFALDTNKRVYQYDSASAATADDFAVVTATGMGVGRYILTNAVPKTTTLRKVLGCMQMVPSGNTSAPVDASQQVRIGVGGAGYLRGLITGLNAGDVISEIEVVGNSDGVTGAQLDATFYLVQADDGDTSPSITNLGTVTIVALGGQQSIQSAAAPLPITIPEGSAHDFISVVATANGGGASQQELYWVAVNGTRSYITE